MSEKQFMRLVWAIALVFGLFTLWAIFYAIDEESDCHKQGGVMVRGHCIDQDAVIE